MSDFYKQNEPETVEPQNQEQETIKVGEKEYSQEDLNKLVGLGEIASELESKWNTKIDRLMPEYTKTTQELKSLKEKEAELETLKQQLETKQQPSNPEWNDETKAQAKKALQEIFGDELLTKKEVDQLLVVREQAKSLITEAESVLSGMAEKGLPKTTVEQLLSHMQETGIKNPEKAYKDMYEVEIDKWKENQMKSLKQPSFQTTSVSSAGSKEPAEVPVTSSNLRALLKEKFNS